MHGHRTENMYNLITIVMNGKKTVQLIPRSTDSYPNKSFGREMVDPPKT